MSYDLLTVPNGYKTVLALVIAPYFDPMFARRLVEKLSPERIRFIVDEGANPKDVEKLMEACGGPRVTKIALGTAPGIFHMKVFYFVFEKAVGKKQQKRRLIFGSANATEAAFCGNFNAELIADVDLFKDSDSKLLAYLDKLVDAVEAEDWVPITAEKVLGLKKPPTLYLPSFEILPVDTPPGFDLWLQSGLLAAKYRNDQQFLHVLIPLKKALPKDQVEKVFAEKGLITLGARDLVRYSYLKQPIIADSEYDHIPKWKARYCVWTYFGDWISDDCYGEHRRTLHAKSSPDRKAKVKELLKYTEDEEGKTERRQAFLDTLGESWRGLMEKGLKPFDFLDGNTNGINAEAFSRRFDKKIEADLCLAQNKDFRNRYVKGYEFPKLPCFRHDTAAWNNFTRSFGESIAIEAVKPSTESEVVKAIRIAFCAMRLTLVEMKPTEIIGVLRKHWEKRIFIEGRTETVGEVVSGYFWS